MWSLYCDLSATLWKWSLELLILRTNIVDKHSTITGTGIVHYRSDNNDANTLSTCTSIKCDEYRTGYDGQIDTSRHKCTVGIQYKHESKEDIASFISKPVARPEYGMIYQHKGMLLQNLHCRYLNILIKLPNLLDLEQ